MGHPKKISNVGQNQISMLVTRAIDPDRGRSPRPRKLLAPPRGRTSAGLAAPAVLIAIDTDRAAPPTPGAQGDASDPVGISATLHSDRHGHAAS